MFFVSSGTKLCIVSVSWKFYTGTFKRRIHNYLSVVDYLNNRRLQTAYTLEAKCRWLMSKVLTLCSRSVGSWQLSFLKVRSERMGKNRIVSANCHFQMAKSNLFATNEWHDKFF